MKDRSHALHTEQRKLPIITLYNDGSEEKEMKLEERKKTSPHHITPMCFCLFVHLLPEWKCVTKWNLRNKWQFLWKKTTQRKWFKPITEWRGPKNVLHHRISAKHSMIKDLFRLSVCLPLIKRLKWEEKRANKRFKFM